MSWFDSLARQIRGVSKYVSNEIGEALLIMRMCDSMVAHGPGPRPVQFLENGAR